VVNIVKTIYLHNYQEVLCTLCGEPGILTREHKIKAASIRSLFGQTELYIGRSGTEPHRPRFAQSSKSKYLKFNVRICEACNTERTQPGDREFDRLNKLVQSFVEIGRDPMDVFNEDRYQKNQESYLNVFRYFAKLLSCHMAEINAPRPFRLTKFAIGRSDENCIWLWIKEDWQYKNIKHLIEPFPYAAHGGLIVNGSKTSGNANRFHSTLTVGAAQYVFYMDLLEEEALEIVEKFPEFFEWCKSKIDYYKKRPFTSEEKLRLGLTDENVEP
jgi:hypothetical protein